MEVRLKLNLERISVVLAEDMSKVDGLSWMWTDVERANFESPSDDPTDMEEFTLTLK